MTVMLSFFGEYNVLVSLSAVGDATRGAVNELMLSLSTITSVTACEVGHGL